MKYVACYNSLYIFPNKNEATKFFTDCYLMSEGHEQQRYTLILMNLALDEKISRDFAEDKCSEIVVKNSKFENQNIKIKLNQWMYIEDAVNYYENEITHLLEISDKYEINFFHQVPFSSFGIDKKKNKEHCIANYYKDLLEQYNISINSIKDEYISDGIYEITINNDHKFNITVRDKIDEVISNLNSMKNKLKQKEQEEISIE